MSRRYPDKPYTLADGTKGTIVVPPDVDEVMLDCIADPNSPPEHKLRAQELLNWLDAKTQAIKESTAIDHSAMEMLWRFKCDCLWRGLSKRISDENGNEQVVTCESQDSTAPGYIGMSSVPSPSAALPVWTPGKGKEMPEDEF